MKEDGRETNQRCVFGSSGPQKMHVAGRQQADEWSPRGERRPRCTQRSSPAILLDCNVFQQKPCCGGSGLHAAYMAMARRCQPPASEDREETPPSGAGEPPGRDRMCQCAAKRAQAPAGQLQRGCPPAGACQAPAAAAVAAALSSRTASAPFRSAGTGTALGPLSPRSGWRRPQTWSSRPQTAPAATRRPSRSRPAPPPP